MAVAYHFVPIAGLIKPFLIYGEIVRATNVTETGRGRMSEWVASAIPALAIWWMTYLFSLVTGILWAAHGQPYLVSPTVLTIVDTIENLAVARAICVMTAQQLNKAFAMGIDRT